MKPQVDSETPKFKFSIEARERMSQAHKGLKFSMIHKKRIGEANKTRVWKEESRKKISDYNKKHFIPKFGSDNPGWKGGITPINKSIRASLQYKLWRESIFKRDNFTCQICGAYGNKLHVDHWPKTFSQLLEENNILSLEDAIECEKLWDIEANRTLCEFCNKQTPTYLNPYWQKQETHGK